MAGQGPQRARLACNARVQVQREAKAEAKAEAARKEAAALGEGGALAAKTDNHDLMRAIYAIQSQWELCGLGAPNVETIIRCMHMAGEGADVLPAQVEECLVLMHTFGDSLEEHLGFEVRPGARPCYQVPKSPHPAAWPRPVLGCAREWRASQSCAIDGNLSLVTAIALLNLRHVSGPR